jgi:uncharacterized YkwD family protein/spore coat assembly protein SafA
MKKLITAVIVALFLAMSTMTAFAAASPVTYKVVSGDTMWKIAVKYNVGVSEIIAANPQVTNPNLIYPGQTLNIPTVDSSVLSYEQQVIKLTNQKRAENGLAPLKYNWELARVARFKAQDMSDKNYFSHTSPTYGGPDKMIRDFGISYRSMGENIAMGYATPEQVVNAWMNSPGHRANILNASFTEIGVGYVADGNYWSQMFIGR